MRDIKAKFAVTLKPQRILLKARKGIRA